MPVHGARYVGSVGVPGNAVIYCGGVESIRERMSALLGIRWAAVEA